MPLRYLLRGFLCTPDYIALLKNNQYGKEDQPCSGA